jgi:hypothetical protein
MASRRRSSAGTRRRHTRKAGGVTVEGLHSSFDKIDKKVETLISKGATDSDIACCIRKGWSEQFHMSLSAPAVKGMITHYRAVHKGVGKKTRKQRGGMAPMDWVLGAGVTDKVYGNFPVEMGTSPLVNKGLDLGRFYESDGGRACNTTGGHPAPGLSQKGGSVLDSIANGYFFASMPRNIGESIVSSVQGKPILNPPPSPVTYTAAPPIFFPKPFDAGNLTSIASLAPVYKAY